MNNQRDGIDATRRSAAGSLPDMLLDQPTRHAKQERMAFRSELRAVVDPRRAH